MENNRSTPSRFEDWIIAENSHWLAIDKPSGWIVEKSPYTADNIEEIAYQYLKYQHRNPYLGIIHRLDKVTSGVLLLAKKRSALRHINKQFSDQQIRKTYWALVSPKPHAEKELVTHWHFKDQKNKKALVFNHKKKDTKLVRLEYQCLYSNMTATLLEVYPHTGKFHQIRAQLAALGTPILGDKLYGSDIVIDKETRVYLHAKSISFKDPKTDQMTTIESKAPKWAEMV